MSPGRTGSPSDHRDVQEEEEHDEVGGEPELRPVPAVLDLAPNDGVLRTPRGFHRRHQGLDHSSSRRFEKRVITQTPIIRTMTSSTAEAAPCGYWIAPIFE